MLYKDIWLSLFRQDQSLWTDLDLRLRHFEKLLKRIPLAESQKLKLTQEVIKEKSGYFACLVNRNIDVLLLHEFFETRKSRNILLNRETDRYMQVFNAYSFSGKTNLSAVYQYLDVSEEPAAKSSAGLDLFSGVTVSQPENKISESLLKQLQAIETFTASQSHMPFIYKAQLTVWELVSASGFENKREALHYLNYCFDSESLKCYKLINLEQGLCEAKSLISSGKLEPQAWSKLLYDILQKELNEKISLLRSLYREEIKFEGLKASQKIASNYLFETAFDTALHNVKANDTEQKLLRAALKSGTLYASDITKLLALGKQSADAQNFLHSGYFIQDVSAGGESMWTISTSHFSPHRLSIYNNMPFKQKEIVLPVITGISEPVAVAAETEVVSAINEIVEEIKPAAPPIRKAFFG